MIRYVRNLCLVLFVLLLSFVAVPSVIFAQETQEETITNLEANPTIPEDFGLPNTVQSVDDNTLNSVLQSIFLAAGAVSFIFIVVGGLRYVISEGNEQKIKQAKDTILYAIVGLGVSLSGFLVVRFFLSVIL